MSESITVTLPDGSQKSVPPGSRPLDIAKSIGQRLAESLYKGVSSYAATLSHFQVAQKR